MRKPVSPARRRAWQIRKLGQERDVALASAKFAKRYGLGSPVESIQVAWRAHSALMASIRGVS
jgi:hypothetical protein